VAMRDDDDRASERNEDADYLPQRRLLAIEDECDRRDQKRPGRDDQKRVDRLRVLQGVVADRVVDADAEERNQRENAEARLDRAPVAARIGQREAEKKKK